MAAAPAPRCNSRWTWRTDRPPPRAAARDAPSIANDVPSVSPARIAPSGVDSWPRRTSITRCMPVIKERFAGKRLRATEFRGQTTLIVDAGRPARGDAPSSKRTRSCDYEFLSDVGGVDYLGYPDRDARPLRRHLQPHLLRARRPAVRQDLPEPLAADRGHRRTTRPSWSTRSPTSGPAPSGPSERSSTCTAFGSATIPTYDASSPGRTFPAHPLRKDYPLRGRGERELYKVLDRTSG